MFNKTLALAAIGLLLLQNLMAFSMKDTADAAFEKLAKKYIAELMERNPELATGLGEHQYDNRLNDYSLDGVKKEEISRRFEGNSVRQVKQSQQC